MLIDYYHILGVDITATQKEITAAYRAACKRFHPDLNPGMDTTEKMQEVNEAYHVLSDPLLRWQYNELCGYNVVESGNRDLYTDNDTEDEANSDEDLSWWYDQFRPPWEQGGTSSSRGRTTYTYERSSDSEARNKETPWWVYSSIITGMVMMLFKSCNQI